MSQDMERKIALAAEHNTPSKPDRCGNSSSSTKSERGAAQDERSGKRKAPDPEQHHSKLAADAAVVDEAMQTFTRPSAADLAAARKDAASGGLPYRATVCSGCIQCPVERPGERLMPLPCTHGPYLCKSCDVDMKRALRVGDVTPMLLKLMCPECRMR